LNAIAALRANTMHKTMPTSCHGSKAPDFFHASAALVRAKGSAKTV
jgi:hypothetical protein